MAPVWAKITVWFDRVAGRPFYRLHRFAYQRTGGRVGHRTPAGPMLLVSTVGRKTGQRRTNPLLYMPDGANFVVVGSNGGRAQPPGWILNLSATPQVEVQVGRRRYKADARILTDGEMTAMWPRLVDHYKGWSYYQGLTQRQLKVVSLEPRE